MTSLDIEAARKVMYDLFATGWGSTTPFAFKNEPHQLDAGSVAWALMGVEHEPRGGDGQNSLGRVGDRRYLREGRLFIQLSAPVATGTKVLDGLGKTARDIFEGTSSQGIRFFDGTFRETGTDGKWEQAMVEVEFDYQEIK